MIKHFGLVLAILGIASLTGCKGESDAAKVDLGTVEGAGAMWKGVLIAPPGPEALQAEEEEVTVVLGKGNQEHFTIQKDDGDFAKDLDIMKSDPKHTFDVEKPDAFIAYAKKDGAQDYFARARVDLGQGLALICIYSPGVVGKKEMAEKTVSICRSLQRK